MSLRSRPPSVGRAMCERRKAARTPLTATAIGSDPTVAASAESEDGCAELPRLRRWLDPLLANEGRPAGAELT